MDNLNETEGKIIIAETERLILRRYMTEDLQDLFEYLSDTEVVKYEPYKPLTIDDVKENLKWRIETDEMIAVELNASHKMIGNVYILGAWLCRRKLQGIDSTGIHGWLSQDICRM